MYLRDFDGFTGENVNPPEIIWENDDRYALIAFLLLSSDREIDAEGIKKLDAFMGINQADGMQTELRAVRDAIVREGNIFLESVSSRKKGSDYSDGSGEDHG